MKRLIGLMVLGLGSLEVVAQDNGFYLESIQLGEEEKAAYFVSETGKLVVQEGQTLAHWKVLHIEKDSVLVESEQGKLLELPVHGHLRMASGSSKEEVVEEGEKQSSEEVVPEAASADADQEVVPEGYRKINTPFGVFIVPDQSAVSSVKEEAVETESESKPVEEVSAKEVVETGATKGVSVPEENVDNKSVPQKIRTPFGEFIIESGAAKKGEETPITVEESQPSAETKEPKEGVSGK